MHRYVRNQPGYDKASFQSAKITAAAKAQKVSRKKPTSVALDPQLIAELKDAAKARGIPYQVLMRMFIIEGFERLKRAG
jgi:predicted DNA binding CopG/RHH family protein